MEARLRAAWMDQGGTFTDVVRVYEDGRVEVDKRLSDRADLEALARGALDVRRGTTVATNALLERKGVPVLLLTNRGLGDLPWIGDQSRPELFSLEIRRPEPLCQAVLEVEGRIGADGAVLEPAGVDEDALRGWLSRGVQAVAVVLVHGPLAPEEERRLGESCRRLGFAQVSLGHEVAPSRGLLQRMTTTLADAALSPLLPRVPGHYMRSDGGLARVGPGAAPGEWRGCEAVLSGPAGGVVAVAALCQELGLGPAFGLDMGGTSTDVCRVDGEPERTDEITVGGARLRVPAVRLETVAAGGGSRLSLRAGMYAVGPESAGAEPGPASYGRGGPAALTDAEAVLGRLPGFPSVCGPDRDRPLDLEAARAVLSALDPERPVEEVALGFRAVAHEIMAGAIRRLAAARGVDPAAHALVAFGGAGPGHACGVARRLGIRTVVVPALAGVFSAVGIGRAARRAEVVAPVRESIGAALREALGRLAFSGELSARLAARHRGTSELIEVPLSWKGVPEGTDLDEILLQRFMQAHEQRFGFIRPGAAVEAVEVRVAVEEPLGRTPIEIQAAGEKGCVRAFFDGWQEVPLLPMSAARGLLGPAILTGGGTTVVVEPGWQADFDNGSLILQEILPLKGGGARLGQTVSGRRGVAEPASASQVRRAEDPATLAIFATRITAIAEQMGERLQRLARSVSIRERRDFSCAVFDRDGQLIANAPHVPVHLGAMGETVRDLIARRSKVLHPPLRQGQCWVSNDPYAGGSHLPDITVVAPVDGEQGRIGFVACRGHHVDVGGISPGSMPPFSRRIEEEGIVLRQLLLAEDGRLHPPDLDGCRQPDEVLADLEAQVAACTLGTARLRALSTELGEDLLQRRFSALLDRAAAAVEQALLQRPGLHEGEERLDDGTLLRVRLEVEGRRARLHIDAPAHPGNLNAPRGVARAALLYVFRCLVAEDLPLNEGALRPFTLELSPGGLFDPQPPAAVAGGNVETSQRLVDALLVALKASAASQGTMNNLTVGTEQGAFYETIGGGSGAGPGFAGAHAVQVHMTNTRATDVEELESRFPVRLERWERRRGSGGAGRYPGGDGVLKQWLFLGPARVALLAGRRTEGAPGLEGGLPGAPGRDLRQHDGTWQPAPPEWQASPGDRLRIETPGGGGFGKPRVVRGDE